jgi:hypothetical protein
VTCVITGSPRQPLSVSSTMRSRVMGPVATYAELLSDEQPQELLQATLDEEKRAAQKLTELPKAINVDAAETIGDEPEDTSLI